MIDSHFEWQVSSLSTEESVLIDKIQQELNISPILIKILFQRGLKTTAQIHEFLNPSPEGINNPFLLNDMELTIERINDALFNGEKITIYGDYDTDGITSTALLYEALISLDANVDFYIPNRFNDGYGPNKDVYARLIEQGTQLIITVDNGVAGHEAIEYANEHGVDVIITDHHELPVELPNAYAIVHPQHPEGNYPFKQLSGVGVAFKVVTALLDEIPEEMLDLVALGEIADLVPLIDENRILVSLGLAVLSETMRPGLRALMEIANVNSLTLTSTDVAFSITPRLNAIGRLQSANLGVQLLVTQDINEAQELAKEVDDLNTERKQIVADILLEAKAQLATMDLTKYKTVVLAGNGWHEGVLGIVASQVVEITQRPTIILRNENEVLKGSARSVDNFNLYEALAPHAELFIAFGGHAGAAGLSLPASNLEALQTAFNLEAENQNLQVDSKSKLLIDGKLPINEITDHLYTTLQKLEPFGNGNPQPIFEVVGDVANIKQIGADKNHLKFNLAENDVNLPVLAFGYGELGNGLLVEKSTLGIVGTLSQNTWQGQVTIQLMVKDLHQNGLAIIDQRTNKLRPDIFKFTGQYVFFNTKVKDQLTKYLTPESTVVDVSKNEAFNADTPTILVDLPKSIDDLAFLKEYQFKEIRVIFYTAKHIYLEKIPTKNDFGTFYKYCLGHANIPIRAELEKLAKYLRLSKNQLSLMISVFFELGFVKIENGVLNALPNPLHADLTSAPSYQAWLNKQAIEKSLIYSKTSELTIMLEQLSMDA